MINPAFERYFGQPPQGSASAPGRVNLIGEFTDYNGGWVLPCALQFRCQVTWRRRTDNTISVMSREYPQTLDRFDSRDGYKPGDLPWANYVRAVIAALQTVGYVTTGIDLLISSDVPQGRGLSSSAALEVALLGALSSAFDWPLGRIEIARLGQLAENQFIGCQCGIMDQLVSAVAVQQSALLLDCRSLETKSVALPNKWALVVLDSNHPRQLVDSEYNSRRVDCNRATEIMGVSSLRDATHECLDGHRAHMTLQQYQRARHVIEENSRVAAAACALQAGNLDELSRVLAEGHHSLATQFEVTVPATDALVAIAKSTLGTRVAARQTGGGFGGAVVCLCGHSDVERLIAAVHRDYPAKTGLAATALVCTPGRGLESLTYD